MSVTLFNGAQLGGTCLNEGCIPTKCLCRNAEAVAQFKEAEKFGIDDFTFSFDFNKVTARKNEVADQLRSGIATMLKSAKVNVVEAMASFKDSRTIVASWRRGIHRRQHHNRFRKRLEITAHTGSRPRMRDGLLEPPQHRPQRSSR